MPSLTKKIMMCSAILFFVCVPNVSPVCSQKNTSETSNVLYPFAPPIQLDSWFLRYTVPLNPDDAVTLDVAYGNGVFVAAGTKIDPSIFRTPIVYRSEDGTNWSEISVDTTAFDGLIFANGLFVGVCRYDNILTSPDGITWTVRYTERDGTGFSRIAYGNGRFVTLGSEVGKTATSYTSENGITWQKHFFPCRNPDTEMMDIAFGNGVFVAVGSYGQIFVSSDGVNWTQPDSGLSESLDNVVFANGIFIAKAFYFYGRWLTSNDGMHWTIHTENLPGTNIRPDWLAVAHGIFFTSGSPSGGGSAVEAVSLDGTNWDPINFPGVQVGSVAYGKRTFVVITPYGEIYQSVPDTSPATLTVEKLGTGFGTVTSSPAGIDCGTDCSEAFTYGSAITITAQADIDSTFTGWSGACSGTNTVCALTMDDDLTVTATFYHPPQPSVAEGTIGTVLSIAGSDLGTKKGKVLIGGVATKIAKDGWMPDSINCALTKVPPAGTHDMIIRPYKAADIVLPSAFAIRPPEIDSLNAYHGAVGTPIIITGNFFGTKKGKVYLEVPGGKTKTCKVTSWGMDSITFVVPKGLVSGTAYPLKVMNKVGLATAPSGFTIE